jgi:hypothetical protein
VSGRRLKRPSFQSVKDAIAKGRPLIASFSNSVVTTPIGGHGLALPMDR